MPNTRMADDLLLENESLCALVRGLREKLAAVEHFAGIWRDTFPELPDAYDCTYTCAEANAAAGLYEALGDHGTAVAIIAAHAAYDDDSDEHYREDR